MITIYGPADIAHGLAASLALVVDTTAAGGQPNADFVRGAVAMARAQALAYGLDWADVLASVQAKAPTGGEKSVGALLESGPAIPAHLHVQRDG